MNLARFDTMTRQMDAIDRKTSLKVLGGSIAVLAATRPFHSAAKKKKNGKNKRDRGCRKVAQSCKQYWSEECPNQNCRDNFHNCCEHFGTCNGQYFECVSNLAG